MNVQIVGNKLFINGYIYYHSKYRTQWECVRLRAGECKTRAVTNNPAEGEELVVIRGPSESPHAHPPNFNECKAEKVRSSVKRKSTDQPDTLPSKLLRTEMSGLSPGMSIVMCNAAMGNLI